MTAASGSGAGRSRLDPLAWLRGLAGCLERTTCEHRGRPVPLEAGLEMLVRIWSRQRADGARVYWAGNGGSAAVVSHLSQDLLNRCGIRSLTFNDSALITCMANDYGYRDVFTRPLATLAQEGDVLVAVSSSGTSDNIVGAAEAALGKGLEGAGRGVQPGVRRAPGPLRPLRLRDARRWRVPAGRDAAPAGAGRARWGAGLSRWWEGRAREKRVMARPETCRPSTCRHAGQTACS